jgi:hypothetical protein
MKIKGITNNANICETKNITIQKTIYMYVSYHQIWEPLKAIMLQDKAKA